MQHWNGNVMVAIDTETTGLDPDQHEIWEIAIVALNHKMEPVKGVLPFELLMQPLDLELIDDSTRRQQKKWHNWNKILDAAKRGTPPDVAAELFEQWVEKLDLPFNKYGTKRCRLIPVGHNYGAFDQRFLKRWLGPENYEYFFDHNYLDTMTIVNYLNDCCGFRAERIPFPKKNLRYVASQLQVNDPRAHCALEDALVAAAVYRKLVQKAVLYS